MLHILVVLHANLNHPAERRDVELVWFSVRKTRRLYEQASSGHHSRICELKGLLCVELARVVYTYSIITIVLSSRLFSQQQQHNRSSAVGIKGEPQLYFLFSDLTLTINSVFFLHSKSKNVCFV